MAAHQSTPCSVADGHTRWQDHANAGLLQGGQLGAHECTAGMHDTQMYVRECRLLLCTTLASGDRQQWEACMLEKLLCEVQPMLIHAPVLSGNA
jgi:hypothetical protein